MRVLDDPSLRVSEQYSISVLGYYDIKIFESQSLRVLEPPSLDVVESQGVRGLSGLKELRGTSRNQKNSSGTSKSV